MSVHQSPRRKPIKHFAFGLDGGDARRIRCLRLRLPDNSARRNGGTPAYRWTIERCDVARPGKAFAFLWLHFRMRLRYPEGPVMVQIEEVGLFGEVVMVNLQT